MSITGANTAPRRATLTVRSSNSLWMAMMSRRWTGETIWQAAKRHGTDIPHLCYSPEPGYRADGNCRACMVEIEGERVLAASCIRTPANGMKVKTDSDRAKTARKHGVRSAALRSAGPHHGGT